ncbi:YceI family protein [Marinagarivorans algicola]|uniref:YceI family protein n=1 Tax=Marinagarivorans algicola TaxID=1513270 RepID=UPI0009EB6213|nr:YceI family protein [Marinagarivorans algicola]
MFNFLNNNQVSTLAKKSNNKVKAVAASLAFAVATSAIMPSALADDYVIDTKGAHAFVQFRIKHLGYSWLYGRFNEFGGEFTYDAKDPTKNKVTVDINVASIDSMHAERDKHLRGKKFLDTGTFPSAKFVSTSYKPTGEKTADLSGNLTLHGVTKPITIAVEHIGGGSDPWGGYRHGFEGSITIKPQDFGMDLTKSLGASASEVELFLSVEGIRK